MYKVRKLNDHGLEELIKFCKTNWRDSNKGKPKPNNMTPPFPFDDDDFSEELQDNINISEKPWENSNLKDRFSIAKHIHELNISHEDINDIRLWAWLSIFFWDKLVSKNNWLNRVEHYVPIRNKEEKKLVLKFYKQSTMEKASGLASRHNIFGPFEIYEMFGDDGNLFINKDPTKMGDGVEQPMNRRWLKAYKKIFIAYLDKHFKDQTTKDLTISFSSPDRGQGRRLIEVINSINYAYNLRLISLSAFPNLLNNKNNPEFPY